MFVHEKIKRNKLIFLWAFIGLVCAEILILFMWASVLFLIKIRIDIFILMPVGFSAFWAFLSGFVIRGIEVRSFGIDLHNMDTEEIDIAIGFMAKRKREIESLRIEEQPEKKNKSK